VKQTNSLQSVFVVCFAVYLIKLPNWTTVIFAVYLIKLPNWTTVIMAQNKRKPFAQCDSPSTSTTDAPRNERSADGKLN